MPLADLPSKHLDVTKETLLERLDLDRVAELSFRRVGGRAESIPFGFSRVTRSRPTRSRPTHPALRPRPHSPRNHIRIGPLPFTSIRSRASKVNRPPERRTVSSETFTRIDSEWLSSRLAVLIVSPKTS